MFASWRAAPAAAAAGFDGTASPPAPAAATQQRTASGTPAAAVRGQAVAARRRAGAPPTAAVGDAAGPVLPVAGSPAAAASDAPRASSSSTNAGRSRVLQPAASSSPVVQEQQPQSSSGQQEHQQEVAAAASPLRANLPAVRAHQEQHQHQQLQEQLRASTSPRQRLIAPLLSVFHNPLAACAHLLDQAQAATAADAVTAAAAAAAPSVTGADAVQETGTKHAAQHNQTCHFQVLDAAQAEEDAEAAAAAAAAAVGAASKVSGCLATPSDSGGGARAGASLDQTTQQQQSLQDGTVLACAAQQYAYDEATGQLVRVGEGGDTTRRGRHFLEDAHTGEFFPLAHAGAASGWWSWLPGQRRPTQDWLLQQRMGGGGDWPAGGVGAGGGAGGGLQQSVGEFTEAVGSGIATLGLFAQGMAGGLGLLCLFLSYLQYSLGGQDAFLAFYVPQAQLLNRTYSSLLALSLVAATSRHAYDRQGHFSPGHLRLGLVDSVAMLLYLAAYTANLLATPTDDALTDHAHGSERGAFAALPEGLEGALRGWHVLHALRMAAAGAAWALACWRGNPYVMLRVFDARQQQALAEAQEGGGDGGGGGELQLQPTQPVWAVERRQLGRCGSSACV